MKSQATPRFWAAYRALPSEVRGAAQKAYGLFRENPQHPGLQFKRVGDREAFYSVRITLGYRAVGLLESHEITGFWIGSHADYDRLLKNL